MDDARFLSDLRRYWDEIARGGPASPGELDPELAALIRRLHATPDVPPPNPTFARNLRESIMHATAAPIPFSIGLPFNGRTLLPTLQPSTPASPPPQPLRSWQLAQTAAMLFLLATLVAGAFWFQRHGDRPELVPAVTSPSPSDEQPADIPMYKGNPARTGEMPGPGPNGQPVELWRVQIDGQIKSAPAIVGGTLFIGGGDGAVYALDAATGEERWTFAAASAISSSPAIASGLVYIGSDDGVLHALNAASGEEEWSFPGLRPEASVAVVDAIVYAAGGDGFLYALDGTLGTERWRAALGEAASRSVAVADGLVYVGSEDGVLHAFAADTGQERWRSQTMEGTLTTPVVADGLVFQAITDGETNRLHSLDAVTGEERWTFAASDNAGVFSPTVGDGTVYLPSADGNLYALDADTGQELWRFASSDKIDASPALVGDMLYVAGIDRALHAVDAATGEERWSYALDGGAEYGPTVTGGVAYLGTRFGTVYAVGGSNVELLAAPVVEASTPPSSAGTVAATPAASPIAAVAAPVEFLWRTTGGLEPLTFATGLALDADGNLWVADAGRNRFQIFTPDGEFLETWGEAGTGEGQFDFLRPGGEGITDIVVAPDSSFYVADSQNARVQHFAADRSFIRAIGSFGTGDGQFIEPIGVDVDAAGHLYVIDDERDVVQKFDAEGNYLLTFGGHGSEEGQINGAGWGGIGPDGTLWVTDPGSNRVQLFAPDGTFLQSIGRAGDSDGEFNNPQTVTVDSEGRVFVGDLANRRVQVFTADGEFITSWTGDDAGGSRFANVGHVELDHEGNIYVGEWSEEAGYEAVQKFRLLSPLGPEEMATPAA
jgi:outer membrane protein assembly factor BamB